MLMLMLMLVVMAMVVVVAVMMVITTDHNGFSCGSLSPPQAPHWNTDNHDHAGVHILPRFAGQTLQNWLGNYTDNGSTMVVNIAKR